jgi:hypothetical protein
MMQSTQINKPFGKTLEFSTTVTNGKITGQEIVSSGPDALVSFKIEGEHALTGMDLRKLSQEILAAQFEGYALCTQDESVKYISQARQYFDSHIMFGGITIPVNVVWMLAEFIANDDHKTLYGDVAVTPEPLKSTNVNSVSGNVVSDNDEDEEDDDEEWDDYDEDYEDDEDWEEDDIAGWDDDEDSCNQLCHDESYRRQQGNDPCLKTTE